MARHPMDRSARSRLPRLPAVAGLCAALAACGGSPAPPPAPRAPATPLVGEFSAERAWADLEGLVALGPRPPGSEAAAAARRRIREAVEAAGVAVETVETPARAAPDADGTPRTLKHLVATVPGASSDRFVFVAPYDSAPRPDIAFVGANQGASGAALLVELVRVLAGRELPYTSRFVWLEGEGGAPDAADPAATEGADPPAPPAARGSESLARHWSETGELEGIRLLVAFDRVCDADLEIARDLGSYRWHREEFWRAAERLGRTEVFAPERGFETFRAGHLAFRERGVRPVVGIADTAFGGDEPPGLYAGTEQDVLAHCAPASLEAVGAVTLEVVDTIGRRLARIDRFTRTPTTEPDPEDEVADGGGAP